MSNKVKKKLVVDILMTGCLLFLMPYELVGPMAHEWIGMGMFLLFVLHHILNRKWTGSLMKGKYAPIRIVQTVLAALVLVSMLGSMVSGVLMSRYVFAFLDIRGAASFARNLHMFCAYWGFAWMSLHLGLHWSMMTGIAGKIFGKPSSAKKWAIRAVGLAIAGYGAYAFWKRQIGSYMLLKIQFVFFDFEEPIIFFILDYMAVMGMFVFIGHYFCESLRRAGKINKKERKNHEKSE